MDNQKTFDMVVAHLRKQGEKCGEDNDGNYACYYRHEGMSCAAGCLIPDEDYSPDMENLECNDFRIAPVLVKAGHEPRFVREMQVIHDTNSVEDWEIAFEELAKRFNLEYTPA